MTITNYYKLLTKLVPGYWLTHSAHKAFYKELSNALFNHSERLIKPPGPVNIIEDVDIHKAPTEEHGQRPVRLGNK